MLFTFYKEVIRNRYKTFVNDFIFRTYGENYLRDWGTFVNLSVASKTQTLLKSILHFENYLQIF